MRRLLAASALLLLAASPAPAAKLRPHVAFDVYGPGNAGRGIEEDAEQFAARIGAAQSSVDVSPGSAFGIRAGASARVSEGLDVGGSVGWIRGPSADATLTASRGGATGELRQERRAQFLRAMIEPTLNIPLREDRSFHLSAGMGVARGWLKDRFGCSGNVCLMAARESEAAWTGFAWELSPYFVFDHLMFGLRVAGFPKFKGDDDQSKMNWTTFGIFGGYRF